MTRTRRLLSLTTKGLFAKNKLSRSLLVNNNIKQNICFTQFQTNRKYTTDTPTSVSNISPKFFYKQLPTQIDKNKSDIAHFSCEAILDELATQLSQTGEKPFNNVMVVAMQHILGTTVEMFKVLKKLGLEHVIIGGKSYSTHKDSIQELKDLGYTFVDAPDQLGYGRYDSCMQETVTNIWNAALNAMQEKPADLLIILDDGGDLILSTPGKLFNGISYKPKRVIGIEQTRGGSNHRCFNGVPFPIINVAGSYVKTTIEYPWVAEIVAARIIKEVQKKAELESIKKPIIGVVGNGTMGKAIINKFRDKGYLVLAHDKMNKTHNETNKAHDKKVVWRSNIPSLISDANIIIGCTGTDITADTHTLSTILSSIEPKYFVSTSSKDIEFNSLLIYIQEQKKQLEKTPNPLADIEYTNSDDPEDSKIVILRGGFPLNFDNKKHSVPPEKIWPTRAALMSACLMAVHAFNNKLLKTADVLKLDAYAQQIILQMYKMMNPNDLAVQRTKELANGNLREFISQQSDGSQLNVFSSTDETYQQAQSPSMISCL